MSAQSLSYLGEADGRHANENGRTSLGSEQTNGARAAVRVIAGGAEAGATRDEALLTTLRDLPAGATLRDVVGAVLGERPTGHGQTYANVVLLQRALARLAEAASGRAIAPWEPER